MKSKLYSNKGLLTLIGILCFSIQFYAQSAISVTPEEAQRMAEGNKDLLGFEKIYFSHQDLSNIINMEDCDGVRFYTAKLAPEDPNQSLIAVGVDAEGNEKGRYVKSMGLLSEDMSMEDARLHVANSSSSEHKTLAVTLDRQVVTRLIGEGGDGVNMKPGENEGDASLIAVPVMIQGEGDTQEVGTMNMLGAAPCPHACGGGNYLIQMN